MEGFIAKRDAELKELAKNNAKHFAKRNLPAAKGDNLAPFSNVSDVSLNHVSEVSIENANMWFSNEMEREKQIQKIQKNVSQILTDASKDTVGRYHSSIYVPVANELNRLSQSKAQKKIMLIYSDLMENDLDVSLYSKNEFLALQNDPNSLKEVFEKRQTLNDLSGIEVYIIYQPTDVEKDKEFSIVSEFYKKLLEEKGAKVSIGANLSN